MIKSLLLLTVLFAAAAFGFSISKAANYAGTWTLDKSQSKNLPPPYENVKSHKLFITQDEKTLTVMTEIIDGEGTSPKKPFVYNLDGTLSQSEAVLKNPTGTMKIPATRKAEVLENGNLKITVEMDFSRDKKAMVENWQVSQDGKTLTIHRSSEMPDGRVMEVDMVFVKE